jgi:hypothetical protein
MGLADSRADLLARAAVRTGQWLTAYLQGLAFLGALALCAQVGLFAYHLDRDLDSLLDRAQVAANAGDMLGYMQSLRANMVRYHATSGHTAYILQTPRNDLGLYYQAVERIIERLTQVQHLEPDTAAYQTALDDVRGIVRELPRLRDGVLWCSLGGLIQCSSIPRRE